MTRLICPYCEFPISILFANLFPGNKVECPLCHKECKVRFDGRLEEYDEKAGGFRVVTGGRKYLIPVRTSGDFKGKDPKVSDTVQSVNGVQESLNPNEV